MSMKHIKPFQPGHLSGPGNVLFEDEGTHDYGCSMVYFDMPMMEALHKIIDKDDVYTDPDGDRSYGLEEETHTTLLYGLHDDVKDEDVIDRSTPKELDDIVLSNASLFENDDYDVLKLDASAAWLKECNKKLAELPHTTDYPDYHPHATVGYLKPGTGQKYVDMLKGMEIKVTPNKIVYSKADGTKVTESY